MSAPALSSYQDEITFSYDKVKAVEKKRPHLQLPPHYNHAQLVSSITEYYSLDHLVSILGEEQDGKKKYGRITLQFPDELICDAATIVHELQRRLGYGEETSQKFWILADTSYSPCCVDEVAAEHVNSDLVVHYGDACLNPIDKVPSLYVLGKPAVDIENITQEFHKRYPVSEYTLSNILLMADSPHTTCLEQVYKALVSDYPNLKYADLYLDPASPARLVGYEQLPPSDISTKVLNRTINNSPEVDLSEFHLFHITMPKSPRLLQLTTRFSSVTIYDEKKTVTGPYPNLMRRYRYMQVARTAGTIGLLVNTLSLANTKKLINSMASRIKAAGKKHYIFVVGKPNVAKLANFEHVDMWCVLGCDHQGIILDQHNEYFKPIITPYELILALNDDLTWTGKWETDFAELLKMNEEEKKEKEENEEDDNEKDDNEEEEEDDDEDKPPEFDPVTGKYISSSRPLRQLQHQSITASEDSHETGLVKRFSSTVAIKNTVSTSAAHLQNRHWTGLGSDYTGDEDGALVEEGRAGIARGYDYDREQNIERNT